MDGVEVVAAALAGDELDAGVEQSAERLSDGTDSSSGMRLSEQTRAKARAVLPAEATTSTRCSSSAMRAQTEKASVSLNEQVVIVAPMAG